MPTSRLLRAALGLAVTGSLALGACGDDDGADVRNVGEEGSESGSGSGSGSVDHEGSGSGSGSGSVDHDGGTDTTEDDAGS